jgi:hypothetical protein
MSIAEPLTVLKAELMHSLVPQGLQLRHAAFHEGTTVHQAESQLWELALQLGLVQKEGVRGQSRGGGCECFAQKLAQKRRRPWSPAGIQAHNSLQGFWVWA